MVIPQKKKKKTVLIISGGFFLILLIVGGFVVASQKKLSNSSSNTTQPTITPVSVINSQTITKTGNVVKAREIAKNQVRELFTKNNIQLGDLSPTLWNNDPNWEST